MALFLPVQTVQMCSDLMFSSIFISQWLLPWRARLFCLRSDFSSSQGWWLIFRDYHVMIDNAPISDDLTEKWHTLAYFHYFEVLMDEMMNEGFSSDPFRTLSRLKQLGHTCEWSCLSLKPAWLTKIPSFIDQSCKYQFLCATMITLCDHPLDGCLRFFMNDAIFVAYASNILTPLFISGYGLFNYYRQKWKVYGCIGLWR